MSALEKHVMEELQMRNIRQTQAINYVADGLDRIQEILTDRSEAKISHEDAVVCVSEIINATKLQRVSAALRVIKSSTVTLNAEFDSVAG